MTVDEFAATYIETTPDAVMMTDGQGIITYWNAGCERIFGFTADEARGQSLDIIIPENLRARHWQGWEETMRTGTTRYGNGDLLSVPALRKDGRRISVEFSILPFLGPDGRIAAMGATMRDVTARFDELKALRKAASAAARAAPSAASGS
jgi:PAS domain S-box-containing protein